MGIPKKALRRQQLSDLTAGPVVKDSAHSIIQVSFMENGVNKTGFFKGLEPGYPELLAKISVAASHLHRMYMGKNCAEERLVFDEQDKLVGTLSIAIEGFKPFNYASESAPSDAMVREQVIPSTHTLIEKNFIAAAFSYWFGDNDDPHPHNNGFAKEEAIILDFDMFFYWFTVNIKVPRPGIGIPKKRIDLSVRDWETFPIVKDSKPYHWPTYSHPGQETLLNVVPLQASLITHTNVLPKLYTDPVQFQNLAGNIKAHEQKFAIALKALLTFQPEVIRTRLVEQFADMPLDYTSLDNIKVLLYESNYTDLCNEKTNHESFVDFIMNLYQSHYDNLYKVVVFYMGCDNNGHNIALESTCTSLYRKPSFFRKIEQWMQEQNTNFFTKEDKKIQFDLAQLYKRYNQIWRDAFTLTVKDLLHSCYKLTNKVLKDTFCNIEIQQIEGKKPGDNTLKSAWELIGTMPEIPQEKIACLINTNQESTIGERVFLLIDFTKKFHNCVEKYYKKERMDLTEEDNLGFTAELNALHNDFDLTIRQVLAPIRHYAKEYHQISELLLQFIKQVNFKKHLLTTDEQMKDTMMSIYTKELLPHTDPEVIEHYKEILFAWAKSLKPHEFTDHIEKIIDTYYAPYIKNLSTRYRAKPVKEYLASSQNIGGDERLAYILSSSSTEDGALNQLLIQHLTPSMLQANFLPSVTQALREKNFNKDIPLYVKEVVAFAKNDRYFLHLYNAEGIKLFYKTIYEWVQCLPPEEFKSIIYAALIEYEKSLWFKVSRRKEVLGYKYESQAKNLSLIFLNGEDTSTFNLTLFQKIIAKMKAEIKANFASLQQKGNQLIMQYNQAEHIQVYNELKNYSVEASHLQVALTKRTSFTF